jgi:uncharacterized repeat protein (TIGR01451 family)
MSAMSLGGATSVSGTLGGTSGTKFTVQFFSNPHNFSEGKTFLGSDTVTIGAGGSASFTANLPVSVAAGQFVTATATDPANNTSPFSGAVPVASPSITVARFAVSGPSQASAGAPFSVTVTALDAQGNTVPSYSGTVRFTSSDDAAGLPADYPFVPASDAGQHVFSVTLNSAGMQTVRVADAADPSVSGSLPVTVNAVSGQGQADLSVTLVSPLRVAEGQPVPFQFAVHNAGPAAAAASVLTDPLPAAVLSVTASLSQGTFAVSGGTLTAAFGTVLAGATVTGTITITANEGFLSDAVQVSSTTSDPQPANNVAGTHTLVTDPPLLAQGGFTINAGPGAPAQTLATFTDSAPGEPASAFGAVVAWGDGSTADVVVTPGQATGTFTVLGSHAYAAPGTYTVTVSLFQDGVPDMVVTSTAVQPASPSDPADPIQASGAAVAEVSEVAPVQPPAVGDGLGSRLRRHREGVAAPAARLRHRRRHGHGPAGPGSAALP